MNIKELKEVCLSFPHAAEDAKKGKDLIFSVGGKAFCIAGRAEGDAVDRVSFKCTPEKFAELTGRGGVIPAPRVAKYNWVAVEDTTALDAEEYEDLISRSYLLVFENLPIQERKTLRKSAP